MYLAGGGAGIVMLYVILKLGHSTLVRLRNSLVLEPAPVAMDPIATQNVNTKETRNPDIAPLNVLKIKSYSNPNKQNLSKLASKVMR